MDRKKIFNMVLISFFAALTAVLSQISIPVGPIPINLALFGVYVTGGVLGWKKGVISVLVYMLLGIVGLPVFSNFGAGIGKLLGPTGGYIIGYVAAALIIGAFADKLGGKVWVLGFAAVLGTLACYAFGTAWYVYSANVTWIAALSACVFPFIAGDVIKIALAALLTGPLRKLAAKYSG